MTIHSFDSLTEVFDFLAGADRAAAEAMKAHPIKVEDLQDGDYFVSIRSDIGIVIFGQVLAHLDDEDSYGLSAEDLEFERKAVEDNRNRGYIFARCFSMLCTEGELGDTHVTQIHHKIDKTLFDRAKANGFRHVDDMN